MVRLHRRRHRRRRLRDDRGHLIDPRRVLRRIDRKGHDDGKRFGQRRARRRVDRSSQFDAFRPDLERQVKLTARVALDAGVSGGRGNRWPTRDVLDATTHERRIRTPRRCVPDELDRQWPSLGLRAPRHARHDGEREHRAHLGHSTRLDARPYDVHAQIGVPAPRSPRAAVMRPTSGALATPSVSTGSQVTLRHAPARTPGAAGQAKPLSALTDDGSGDNRASSARDADSSRRPSAFSKSRASAT